MPRVASPLPDDRHDTSFPAIGNDLRMRYSRTRARDIDHPFYGVAAHNVDLTDLVQLAYAYGHRAHDTVAISHGTAARLLGLPLPRRLELEQVVHVTRLDAGRAPRGRGICGHRWQLGASAARYELMLAPSSGEHLPLRILTPIATAVTLAGELSLDDLVAVLDACVEGSDRSFLAVGRNLIRNRTGAARFERAARLVRDGVRSRAETLTRLMIARAGFPEPSVAQPVVTPLGVLHPDLMWERFGVLVEYEGDGHRVSRRQFRHDITRFDAFVDAGLSPIRATADDVYDDPRRLLGVIERRLRERGWRPHSRWRLRVPATVER